MTCHSQSNPLTRKWVRLCHALILGLMLGLAHPGLAQKKQPVGI